MVRRRDIMNRMIFKNYKNLFRFFIFRQFVMLNCVNIIMRTIRAYIQYPLNKNRESVGELLKRVSLSPASIQNQICHNASEFE